MPSFTFPQSYRMKSPAEFERAYARKRSASDGVLIVYACENGLAHPRLGCSVSKKVGGAVVRNRYKRLFREAFRLSRHELPTGTDLVVIPRPGPEPTLDAVRGSLQKLARQAARKLTPPPADGPKDEPRATAYTQERSTRMPTILDDIVAAKRREIDAARERVSEEELERRVADLPPTRDFTASVGRPGRVNVIAEVKKASPSAGVIRADFDPVAIATTYAANGAAAISVLTDAEFFRGSLADLTAVRRAVPVPVLRKDFILDRYQLLEARLAGADAALLIAECLPGDRLAVLRREAAALGLHTLVELHDAAEVPRVLESGAAVIGVNNRDLRTFVTRLEHTLDLLRRIPADRVVVSESGIRTPADLERLGKAGVRAVLVGEWLMRAPDIGAALSELVASTPPPPP
jgi:indole-3-glycerol phosphate synthase